MDPKIDQVYEKPCNLIVNDDLEQLSCCNIDLDQLNDFQIIDELLFFQCEKQPNLEQDNEILNELSAPQPNDPQLVHNTLVQSFVSVSDSSPLSPVFSSFNDFEFILSPSSFQTSNWVNYK